jgi:hypothetical protein
VGAGITIFGVILQGLVGCKGGILPTDGIQDSGDVDTEWVDTAAEVELQAIELYPARIFVEPGAELTMRAVGVYSDGHREGLPELELICGDAALSVDGLTVSALQAGSVVVSAVLNGVVGESFIEIEDTQTLHLQIISQDGQGIAEARVIWQGEKLIADENGTISLPTDTGGPVSFTAFAQDADFVPQTVYGVVSRRLYVTLSHVDGILPPAQLSGTVDFSELDKADPDELRLSLSGTALGGSPVLVSELDLIRPNRTVTIFGAEVDLPENLAIDEHAPEIALASTQEQTQVWTIAGTLPISDLSSGVDNFGQVGALLEAWEPTMRLDESAKVASGGSLAITPSGLAEDQVWVTLPDAAESSLVLLYGASESGWLLQGLATGSGQVRIPSPQTSQDQVVVAWREQGGAGSGSGRSMTMAPVVSGEAELPEWVQVPVHGGLSASTGEFTLSTDPEAVYVRAFVQSANGGLREVIMPPGEYAASLAGDPAMSLGKTQWDVRVIHAESLHYQDVLSSVGVLPAWTQDNTVAVGGLRTEIFGE